MNIKTFIAAAVVALTAACSPTADAPTAAEAAGPAADEALATANVQLNEDGSVATTEAAPAEQPK